MSLGGVGPSDRIGNLNKTLIMRTCRIDGKLLVPDVPIRATSAQLMMAAFSPKQSPNVPYSQIGNLWSTYTMIGQYLFGIIYATETQGFTNIQFNKNNLDLDLDESTQYLLTDMKTMNTKTISVNDEYIVKDMDTNEHSLTYVSPIFMMPNSKNYAIVGETDKLVPVSKERIKNIRTEGSSTLLIDLAGVPNEEVTISIYEVSLESDQQKLISVSTKLLTELQTVRINLDQ